MRGRERDGGKMGLILKRGKGRRSPPGLGFLKGACSLQGRCSLSCSLLLSRSLHVFILISRHPRHSRSIMIDKRSGSELV